MHKHKIIKHVWPNIKDYHNIKVKSKVALSVLIESARDLFNPTRSSILEERRESLT